MILFQNTVTRCREEVDQVLGSKTEIQYEDVPKLKYISCVFKEALRLYPPAPIIRRMIPEEVVIEGYRIPAYSGISVSLMISNKWIYRFQVTIELNEEIKFLIQAFDLCLLQTRGEFSQL